LYCLSTGYTYSIDVTFASTLPSGARVRFAVWAVGSRRSSPDGSLNECYAPPFQWDVTLN
jgi:hypothetical protein